MNEVTSSIRDKIMDVLRQANVKRAALFGSVVSGDLSEESDIDVLVEFEGKKSLLDLADLKLKLEEILGRDVDIITYNSIHPLLRDSILSEQEVIL